MVGEVSREREAVGLNPGVDTYSIQVKNISCEMWLVPIHSGYIKNIFFLFLLDSKWFFKKIENFLEAVDLREPPLKIDF